MPKWLKSLLIVLGSLVLVGAAIYGVLRLVKSRSASDVNVYSMNDVSMFYSYFDQSETEGQVTTDRIQSVYVSATQQVTDIYVEEGQSVQVGDPILAFDTTLNDLELERKRIDIEQLKLDIETAQAERKEMDGYSVYSASYAASSTTAADERTLEGVLTPYLRKGSGTASDPYIFLWGEFDVYSSSFLVNTIFNGALKDTLLPSVPTATATPLPAETPTVTDAPPQQPDESGESSEGTESSEGGESTNPEEPTGDNPEEPTGESGSAPTPTPEPTSTSEATAQPTAGNMLRYAIFERREADSPQGELLDVWQMVFEVDKNGVVSFTVGEPDPNYDSSAVIDDPTHDAGSGYSGPTYTWSELQKMKAEQDRKIIDLQFQLKTAQLEYETIEYELSNGVVYSKISGVVKTVRTVDEALAENQPVVLISGGGGYYVQGYMGELDLDTMRVGDTVDVMSWQSGESMTGTITAISDYPLSDDDYGYYWSQGNSNISKYPFTIFLDEDSPLREGEYVNITFTPGETQSDDDKIYLQNPFLRQENGQSYVYLQGADGLLEKRYVTTGKSLWGSYMEITGGLTLDDYVAFPYGKAVVAGAKTVQADISALYDNMYY